MCFIGDSIMLSLLTQHSTTMACSSWVVALVQRFCSVPLLLAYINFPSLNLNNNVLLRLWILRSKNRTESLEMVSRLSVTQLKSSPAVSNSVVLRHKELCRFGYFPRNSCSEQGLRFKVVGQSLGDRWKLKDIDARKWFFLLL